MRPLNMAQARTRYFSEEDPDIGVTPSQLRRLGKSRQVEYVSAWFHSYYEDPAQETPYNGREGGYLYVHGGPYNARDEIEGEFGDFVSQEVIELAAEEVESDGLLDWAPTSNHPSRADEGMESDYEPYEPFPVDLDEVNRRLEAGVRPNYGDGYEGKLRGRVIRDIEELEFELPREEVAHGGIGHNQPPADMQMSEQELVEARTAISVVKDELLRERPDAKTVARSVGTLKKLWDGVKHHANLAGDEFSKNLGSAAGKVVGAAAGAAMVGTAVGILALFGRLVHGIIEWLGYVTSPF